MFKIGDRVRCIDASGCTGIKEDEEYIIYNIDGERCYLENIISSYYMRRFELIEEEEESFNCVKKDFRVGDKVVDMMYGDGEIISIDAGENYPIKVKLSSGAGRFTSYSEDGKMYESDVRRRLYHAGTTFEINEPTPKRAVEMTLTLCVSDEKIAMCTEEQDVKCFKSLFKDARCFAFKGTVPEDMVERLNDLYSR